MSLVTTDRWFEIPEKARNHPQQVKLARDLNSDDFYHYTIVAGRRSFKTERFGKRNLVKKALEKYNGVFYAGAPVRKQAKEIFWKDLKELIHPMFISKISETELKITLTNKSVINVVGLLEFATIEGGFAHGFLISEWQKCEPEVYNSSIEPMINDVGGWVIKEGRPLGKNHLYDDYLKGIDYQNGFGSYFWTSEEILNPLQIARAKASLGTIDYNREYLASFETGGNPPYYAYNHLNNNSPEYILNPEKPIIITCDFNATEKPMSWVIGQRVIERTIDVTHWIKDFSFPYTNTETMCGIVDEWLRNNMRVYPSHITFYGDYAGKQQKSNSSYSDWQIIEDYFRNKAKIEKRIKPCRSIRDSIAATNAQIANTIGERKQFINPEGCKDLIKDWEYCQWKENGKELSETDDRRGHLCRAVDYYNDFEHSIKSNKNLNNIKLI